LGSFREAVSDLVAEIGQAAKADARAAEHILAKRLGEDEFALVLEETPDAGTPPPPSCCSRSGTTSPVARATGTLSALVRSLLAQIEAVWWAARPAPDGL
jgi:hypothetical protein